MKKTFRLMALAIALSAGFAAHAAESFNYSYTFEQGGTIEGSFTGTADGNLITGLSDITAIFNGLAFNGSGALFGSSSPGEWYGWMSGGAVASFDGTQNNFLFMDADYPNNYNYTNYFLMTPWYAPYAQGADYSSGYSSAFEPSQWTVTAAVPEPETYAMLLLGLGAVALARRTKKSAE